MKYNIKGRTINISYVFNGKVRKLQLNVDDPIDNDFFNKLMKAKSENQDAMCDLFNREILKPHDDNVERVTPLTLTSEIQPTQYTKTEAAKRRAEELKRDKQSVKDQLTPLVKPDTNLDDVKSADEATQIAARPEDVSKVKELLVNLLSIDKVYQIAINEAENVNIQKAQNVKIEKIQSLAVKMYGEIEKYVTEMNLSKQAQSDIMKLIQEALGKIDIKDDTPIPVKYIYQIIPTLTADQGLKLTKYITERGLDNTSDITGNEIKEVLGDQYKAIVPRLQDLLLIDRNLKEADVKFLQHILDVKTDIYSHITDNFEEIWDNLMGIIQVESATTTEEIKTVVAEWNKLQDIKNWLYREKITNNDKSALDGINFGRMYTNFAIAIRAIDEKQDPIKKTQNQLLEMIWNVPQGVKDNPLAAYYEVKGDKYNVAIYILDVNYIKNQVDFVAEGIIPMISWMKTDYPLFAMDGFTFYIEYVENKLESTGSTSYRTSYIFEGNTEKFVEILKKAKEGKGIEVKHNDEGGKLMIDLDSSNFNEKFNELLRLMNQLNYNVYALTPMYQKTKPRFNEKPNVTPFDNPDTKKKTKGEISKGSVSKGIDLLDIISE